MSYTALSAISSHPTRCTDDSELTSVISQLQGLRKTLHEQFIVEEASLHRHPQRNKQLLTASTSASATEKDKFSGVLPNAPPASELHRTLDNPTLSLLKSVNYPFSLCEEAPPSYTPPSVPFDVESEVEQLKRSVLQVQAELQEYLSKLTSTTKNDDKKINNVQKERTTDTTKATLTADSSSGSTNMLSANKDEKESRKCKITQNDVINFFSSNAHFAELAWNVSSLQWFYRWVLSHSISLLWNAKEQLEYVLTESGQALPSSVEEMDRCLASYPFSAAVAILDNDRQMVIAEERRKLNTTVSRTYKNRLPADAVKIATSCYLSAEEKYMYQEFYNQSEHLLLLLRHSQLLEVNEQNITNPSVHNKNSRHKSTSNANENSIERETNKLKKDSKAVRDNWNSNKSSESTRNNISEKNQKESVGGDGGGHSDASNRSSPSKENISIAYIIAEVKAALKAEKEMIIMLLDTIAQRRRDNVFYDISEEEYASSRQAAIAVYGCVASDISLMAFQMTVAAEFLGKYEEWLRYHGFTSHDALMSELCKHNLNAQWPLLDAYTCHAGHANHFVPPTSAIAQMEWMRLNSNVMPEANLLVRDNASNDKEEYQASTSTSQREMEEKDKQANEAKAENKNKVCPQHPPKQQQQQQQHHPFLLSPLPLSSTSEISSLPSAKNKETLPDKKHVDNDNTQCNGETLMAFTHSSVEKPEAQELIYDKQKLEKQHQQQKQEEEEKKQKSINWANNSNTRLPFTCQESTLGKNDQCSCQDASTANDVWSENEENRCEGGNNEQIESILHTFVHILCEVVERYTDMCIADKTLRFEIFSLWEVWLALCVEYTFIWCRALQREVCDAENRSTINRRALPPTNTIKVHGFNDENLRHFKEKVSLEKIDMISKNIEMRLHREAQRVWQKLLGKVKECVKTLEAKVLWLHSLTMKCIDYNDNKESTVEHFVQNVIRFIDEMSNLYDAHSHVPKKVFHSSPFPSSGCDNKNVDNATNTWCDNRANKNKISTKEACAFSINVTLDTITSEDLQICQNVNDEGHKYNSEVCFNKQCVRAFVKKALTPHNVAMWLRVHEVIKHNAELFAINKRLSREVDNYVGDNDNNDDLTEQAKHWLQEKMIADSIDDSINVNGNDNGSGLCTNYTNKELSTLRSSFYFIPAHIYFLPISRIRSEDSEERIASIVIEFDIPETKKYNKEYSANDELQNQQEEIYQQMQQQLHSQNEESVNSAISLPTLLAENCHVKRGDKAECKAENNKSIVNVQYALARWVICSYNQLYKNNLLGFMRCDEHLLKLISESDYIFLQRAQANFLRNCCHSKENGNTDLKELQLPWRSQKSNEIYSIEHPATMYIASPYALDFIRWQTLCATNISNVNVNTNDVFSFALSTSKLYNPEQSPQELWSVYYQLAEVLCDIASSNSSFLLESSSTHLININKSDDTAEMHLQTLQLLAEQLKDDALVLQQWYHEQEHCQEEWCKLKAEKELQDKVYKTETNNVNDTKQKELIAKINKLNVQDVKQTEYAVKRLNFSVILEYLDDYIISWITPRQMLATVRESIYTGDAREASL